MPPCRSRPRLIALFGGYRNQRETRTTAATRPIRTQRFLRILVALDLRHAPDGRAVELELDLVPDAQRDRVLGEARHRPVQAARRHHAVALLDGGQHALALLLLLLLGADHQEVED